MARRTTRVVAAVLIVCLIAVGCGNSNGTSSPSENAGSEGAGSGGGEATRNEFVARPGVPGVTDKEISYDVIGTKTNNPLGTCILDCYVDGIDAYFAYRNSEGGVYGRQLAIANTIDDELGQNQQKSLDIISGDDAFGVFSATLLPAGWGDLDSAGVPTYTWGIHSADSINRMHNFPSVAVRCADCPRPTVPYVAKQAGATKAASIGYGISENSKVCADTYAKSFDIYKDQSGVELAYLNDNLAYGLTNGIGPEVTAMKAAGVDFIASCIDLNGMKGLAEELHRQGMDDVVLYHPNSYDQAFIAESADLFEGDFVLAQFRPLEASAEGSALTEFQTWMQKQGSAPTELAMVGWINASLAFDGLLAAGPEFDRENVTAATNALKGWTAGGLVTPIDWSVAHTPYTGANPDPDDPECAALVRVVDGKFTMFTSPEKPWFCWDEANTESFVPTSTNFE